MMIGGFLFVFQNLAIEFVGKRIDGGIHIRTLGIGMQGRAFGMDSRLGEMTILFDVQDYGSVGEVIEVFLNSADFFGGVILKRFGNGDLVSTDSNLHTTSSLK